MYISIVNCIAGFRDEEVAPLFIEALNVQNIYLPKVWISIINEMRLE